MLSQLTENSEYHIKREDESNLETFSQIFATLSMLLKKLGSGQSQFVGYKTK